MGKRGRILWKHSPPLLLSISSNLCSEVIKLSIINTSTYKLPNWTCDNTARLHTCWLLYYIVYDQCGYSINRTTLTRIFAHHWSSIMLLRWQQAKKLVACPSLKPTTSLPRKMCQTVDGNSKKCFLPVQIFYLFIKIGSGFELSQCAFLIRIWMKWTWNGKSFFIVGFTYFRLFRNRNCFRVFLLFIIGRVYVR